MPQAKTILYIAGILPKRSETFVTSEILALRGLGHRVLCASVHPPERALGDAQLEALADEAIPIYAMGPAKNICLAFQEGIVRPRTFCKTLLKLTTGLVQEPMDAARNAHKFGWQLICSLALAYRIRNQNITHIHAHMGNVPATVAWIVALQLGLPFSFTGHAADLFRHRCLLKTKLLSASFVSCISLWHRKFYSSISPGSALKYPLIRCGVDSARFSPVSTPKGNCMILSVGRLVEKKGFDILLKAFAKLCENGSQLKLLIGGDGPEFKRLCTLRKQLNLESSVHFLGVLSHEEVRKLLPDATLFVLPCRIDPRGDRDGIPVVLMEAMAVGVPCVSGDLPAIRELIADGHTGKLVSSEDTEVWAKTLSQLLGNPAEQTCYSQNGRKWVESEFSSQVNIPRLIAAFEGVHAR